MRERFRLSFATAANLFVLHCIVFCIANNFLLQDKTKEKRSNSCTREMSESFVGLCFVHKDGKCH